MEALALSAAVRFAAIVPAPPFMPGTVRLWRKVQFAFQSQEP